MSFGEYTRGADLQSRKVAMQIDMANTAFCGTSTNSSNAYTLTFPFGFPNLSQLLDGQMFWWRPSASCTGAATLVVPGIALKSIKLYDGTTALVANDIVSGRPVVVQYDLANDVYRLLEPSGGGNQYSTDVSEFAGDLTVGTRGANFLQFRTNGTLRWIISATLGTFYPNADATYDIGLTNRRVIDIYLSGGLKSTANTTWSPTIAASGSMTVTSQSVVQANYFRSGQFIEFEFCAQFTLGGTAHTQVKIPAPVAGVAQNSVTTYICQANENGIPITDNAAGTGTPIHAEWQYDGTNILVWKKDSSVNWVLGGNARVSIQGRYRAV